VVALISPQDIVVASDGLGLYEDGRVASEQYEKSVVLKQRLCLASTGDSKHLREMLIALDLRCLELCEDFPENDFREKKWSIDGGFVKARELLDEAHSRLGAVWINEYTQAQQDGAKELLLSSFLLCGREKTGPSATWYFVFEKDSGELVPASCRYSGHGGAVPIILGVLGKDPLYQRIKKLVLGNGSCTGAEQRLVRAIRLIAEQKPSMMIGNNVLIRRMSRDFKPNWRLTTS